MEIHCGIIAHDNHEKRREKRFDMDNRKRPIINIAGVVVFSFIGAFLMIEFDDGGARWLKFILYVIFFASISSSALFSSRFSCSFLMGRSRK
jgi:hypothetical protein